MKEFIKKDDRGNIIYNRHSDGSREWFKYDDQNRVIYKRDHHGVECWLTYDDENHTLHGSYSTGEEWSHQKNEAGNTIYRMERNRSYVVKEWWEYDESGTILRYYHTNRGEKSWYDESGELIHTIDRGGETWYEYDESGYKYHSKYKNGNTEDGWVSDSPNLKYSKKIITKEYDKEINFADYRIIETQHFDKWKEYDEYRDLICVKENTYTEKKMKRN